MKTTIFLFLLISSINGYSQKQKKTQKDFQDTLSIYSFKKAISDNINLRDIYFTDSIFKFSDYVMRSKVSVFIVTSQYCVPCHELLKNLGKFIEHNKVLKDKVIVNLINVPNKSDSEKSPYQSLGYQCFKNIDELTEIFPTTIIFSPTTNEFIRIVGIERKDKIFASIKSLSKYCK